MALAALCSRLQQDVKFQAFVVDHGVREGSDREAHGVSKLLKSRGWRH